MRPLPRRETSAPDIILIMKAENTQILTENADILTEETVAAHHGDQLSTLTARREDRK